MITRKEVEESFPDTVRLDSGVYKFTLELPMRTIFYYLKFADAGSDGCDFLVSSNKIGDDEFAVDLLSELSPGLPLDRMSLREIPENKYGFSDVLIVPNGFHSVLEGILDHNRDELFLCVPIHRSEFSGDETKDEFRIIQRSVVAIFDWTRKISPRISLRFFNPKTKGGTKGDGYVFVKYDLLVNEIKNLEGVSGGFIEILNYRGLVAEILSERAGVYSLIQDRNDAGAEAMSQSELLEFIWTFLTRRMGSASRNSLF